MTNPEEWVNKVSKLPKAEPKAIGIQVTRRRTSTTLILRVLMDTRNLTPRKATTFTKT